MEITQELVKRIFHYHEDGYLIWKEKPLVRAGITLGNKAGWLSKFKGGDRQHVGIACKTYACSRIIFLWHHGYLPEIVDHKDRNPSNDKIGNLRAAIKSQNMANCNSRKNSSSKYLGVSWDKRTKRWSAELTINHKLLHLGLFKIEEDAALAYNKAAKIHHGEFANINIIIKDKK